MITLTASAITQLKNIQVNEKKENCFLRVRVVGGGCSGMSYKLNFDDTMGDKEKIFDQEGIKVVVDPKSYLYIKGMTLDFSSGLNGKGFEFHNKNAKKSCGCGASFSV